MLAIRQYLLVFSFVLYSVAPVANYYPLALGIGDINFSIISLPIILICSTAILYSNQFKFKKNRIDYWFPILPFLFVSFISIFYSISPSFGIAKISFLFVNVYIAMLFTFLMSYRLLFLYVRFLIVISLLLGLLYPYFYSGIFNYSGDLNNENVAVYLSSGSLLAFCGALLIVLKPFRRMNGLILFIIYFEVFLTGARGPMIFIMLSHLIYEVLINKRYYLLFFLVPFFLYISSFIFEHSIGDDYISNIIWRFSVLSSGGGRIPYFEFSIEILNSFASILFGYGAGSFGLLMNGFEVKDYPHNLFLDVIIDSGVLGLFCLLIFLFFYVFNIVKSKRGALLFIPLLPFLDLMKSFTYAEYRLFWLGLAITACAIYFHGDNEVV